MDQKSLLTHLSEIRNNLLDSRASLNELESKLVGTRPVDPDKMPSGPPFNVQSYLAEIDSLCLQLNKQLHAQHAIIGEPANVPQQTGTVGRY